MFYEKDFINQKFITNKPLNYQQKTNTMIMESTKSSNAEIDDEPYS